MYFHTDQCDAFTPARKMVNFNLLIQAFGIEIKRSFD